MLDKVFAYWKEEEEKKHQLPGSDKPRRHNCGSRCTDGASQVVPQVHVSLDEFAELNHHYVCHGVTKLNECP